MADIYNSIRKDGAKISRNAFNNLSHSTTFTSKLGMLLPVLNLYTVPNDSFEINVSDILRTTFPFEQASFASLKYHLDFHFVPMNQLYGAFNQFIVGRTDFQTSLWSHDAPNGSDSSTDVLNKLPHTNLASMVSFLASTNQLSDTEKKDAMRLLDLLGYGNYSYLVDDLTGFEYDKANGTLPLSSQNVTLFPLLAYQKIFSDFYRNPWFDFRVKASDFNMDSYFNLGKPFISADTLNVNWFKIHQAPLRKDLFTAVLPSASYGAVQTVDAVSSGATFDVYGNGGVFYNSASFDTRNNSLYRAGSPVPHDSNLAVPMSYSGIDGSGTSGYPAAAVSGGDNNDIRLYHTHTVDAGTVRFQMPSSTPYGVLDLDAGETIGSFDVLSLVRAEAMQEWAYTTLRNGNRLSSLWKGHFGTTPDYEKDNITKFLGSFEAQMQINTVTATTSGATTDASGKVAGNVLGSQAATGITSLSGDTIRFNASDYGLIMAIAYVEPEVEYSALGLDPLHQQIERFDWYQPEMDNQGLCPVEYTQYETLLNNIPNATSYPIVGYAPQWYEYKQKLNRVHGEFCTRYVLGNTTYEQGSFSRFVLQNPFFRFNSTDTGIGAVVDNLYVPRTLDDYLFTGGVNDSKQRADHYMHVIYFNIKAIRPMSVLGLPQF